MTRYPLGPLVAAMREEGTGADELGLKLGATGRTIQRWWADGLTEANADRVATKAGWHPNAIWEHWGQVALEKAQAADDARMVPCFECGTRFLPSKRTHRYCTARCKNRRNNREKARRRYRDDPEWRDRQLARVRAAKSPRVEAIKARAYYRAHAEEERAKRRARYWAQKEAS